MTDEHIGRFLLRQKAGVFPLCGDTVALGRFAAVRPGDTVCDLGCGSGALGLLLAERTEDICVTGADIDPAAAALAAENLAQVGGTALCCDLRTLRGRYDLVVSNPPYFAAGRGRIGSQARGESDCTLSDLCAAAGRLTGQGGRFAVVYRPERLAELFAALRDAGLMPKRMALLCHTASHPPYAVLVESVRGGGTGLDILPPILTGGAA